MKRLGLLLVLMTGLASANPIDDKCPDKVFAGAPQIQKEGANQYLCRVGYAVNYSYLDKVPFFVTEHLTADKLNSGVTKRSNNFHPDPELPKQYQATNKDYAGAGYDKGHMSPAGDNQFDPKAMDESFLLSNMMPQAPFNNRGIWKDLEEQVRTWGIKYGELFVISATIYDGEAKTIGDGVRVPSHIYKIVIDPKRGRVVSFLFPNLDLKGDKFTSFETSLSELSKLTNINFFPKNTKQLQEGIAGW